MNIANKLTVFRLILVLPFIILLAFVDAKNLSMDSVKNVAFFWIAGAIFLIAMFTDFLDGYLARKRNMVTNFGKLFDPIADKFMTTTAFIFLSVFRFTPIIIPILMILRDILVDGSRNIAAKNNVEVAANFWGKLKTVLQILAITFLFVVMPFFPNARMTGFISTENWDYMIWLINIPAIIASVVSNYSGLIYVKNIWHLLKV